MLGNGNFLGAYDQVSTDWASGVLEPRSHHAAKTANTFPDPRGVYTKTTTPDTPLGFYTGKFLAS